MNNFKKKIKYSFYLINYPFGLDEEWDKESIKSFNSFLDKITLILSIIVFGMPVASFLTLLIQNYGK